MKRRVLVDTGPLVAILSSVDEHHAACVKALHQLPGPLYSCWPVITEAGWLLRSHPRAVHQLLRSCFSEKPGGFLELLPLSGAEAGAIAEVMDEYQDIRPQLADAALVYLAPGRDRNHFHPRPERFWCVSLGTETSLSDCPLIVLLNQAAECSKLPPALKRALQAAERFFSLIAGQKFRNEISSTDGVGSAEPDSGRVGLGWADGGVFPYTRFTLL